MIDMSATIAPKSDQLNADDLIGGPRTITVTKVTANPSAPEQPISIYFEGDNGKPYKPCKSMRRVMVFAWGKDATAYAGRSMTLYRDPETQFGGLKVGGTRISHMSHIDGKLVMALTATKGNKRAYEVKVLATDCPASRPPANEAPGQPEGPTQDEADAEFVTPLLAAIAKAADSTALARIQVRAKIGLDELRAAYPGLAAKVDGAFMDRRAAFDAGDAA